MPSTVAPGQSVTVDATVDALPAGATRIDFDMYSGATGVVPGVVLLAGHPALRDRPLRAAAAAGGQRRVPADRVHRLDRCSRSCRRRVDRNRHASPTSFTLTCEPLPGTTCLTRPSVTSGHDLHSVLDAAGGATWTGARPTPGRSGDEHGGTGARRRPRSGRSRSTPRCRSRPSPPDLGSASGQAFDPLSGQLHHHARPTRRSRGRDRRWRSTGPTTAWTRGARVPSGPAGRRCADTALRPDNDGSNGVGDHLPDGQQMPVRRRTADGTLRAAVGSPDVAGAQLVRDVDAVRLRRTPSTRSPRPG